MDFGSRVGESREFREIPADRIFISVLWKFRDPFWHVPEECPFPARLLFSCSHSARNTAGQQPRIRGRTSACI